MPKIPRFTSEKVIQSPEMPLGVASGPARAAAESASAVAKFGRYGAEDITEVQEAEEKAVRALKSLEIEREFRGDIDKISESYFERIDYENFETDLDKQLEELREDYAEKIGDDQSLGLAFERMFTQHSSTLRNVIRDKKRQVVTERAIGEYQISYNQLLDDYSNESDPAKLEIIKKDLEIKTMSLVANHVMTLKNAEGYIQNFNDSAESVRADKLIEIDPKKAEKDLKGGEFELSPKIKQQKIEKALAQQKQNETQERIRKNEEEKRFKEAEKEAHDEEELKVADLILKGKYDDAFEIVSKSNLLSGSEKISLTNTIEKKEEVEDNPLVVGDFSESIAFGIDVKKELKTALKQKQISGKTYAAMMKALSKERSSLAVKILNEALAPSQLDRWSPDKNLKHSQATIDMLYKIAAGKDPIEASLETIEDYTSHLRRTRNGLPKPTYLDGDKNDVTALNEAEEVTVTAYELGIMSPDEYSRQIETINDLKGLINDENRASGSNDGLNELKKQIVKD